MQKLAGSGKPRENSRTIYQRAEAAADARFLLFKTLLKRQLKKRCKGKGQLRNLKIHPHSGFTLLEVMISIFLIGITAIGVGSLFLTAFRTTQQSVYQTTALDLASVMADKMRTSVRLTRTENQENPYLTVNYQSTASNANDKAPKLCYAIDANCTIFDIANAQIYEWEQQLKAGLPGARAVICRDSASWDSRTGSYLWDCDNQEAASVVIKIGWKQKNTDENPGVIANRESRPAVLLTVQPGKK